MSIATELPNTCISIEKIRQDFPILSRRVREKPLIYLDNGATTQKPRQVIEAIQDYYYRCNANVHRGIHSLSDTATEAYEQARKTVQHFIHAAHAHEIIFVRGVTEGINLVADSFGHFIHADDEIIVSEMEHHANIVPWQRLCERTGAKLRVLPITDDCDVNLTALAELLNSRTKLLAITHVSNVLGTINPIKAMVDMAHQYQVAVLVDGAQAVPHKLVDVQALGCDFYVFSGHKMYAPTGIGVLYGKSEYLEKMPPYQTGGSMISRVTFAKTTYQGLPTKFEAGTPNIEGAVGLAAAIRYMQNIGIAHITEHEQALLHYALTKLREIEGIKIIGQPTKQAAVLSIVHENIHAHDLGTVLDHEGIAIRAGHHCAMPLMERLGISATARISFGVYNNYTEIDALVAAIEKAKGIFN